MASWTDHVKSLGVGLLSNEVNSWMTGINTNVEGKQTRIIARYSGSAPAYRARCDEVAAKGYRELALCNNRSRLSEQEVMVKPEAVGLSASRLARLDEVMKRRYVDSGRLPGVLTMVYRRGKLAHTGMSGHMDLERDKPMREDAIFRIYSMSKPITAVALMMLVEEGLIGLDDDVATHIPSWKNLGVYATGLPSLVATGEPAVPDDAGCAADEGRGPGHAHLGPDLRVHEPHQRRSRLPPRAHRRIQTPRAGSMR